MSFYPTLVDLHSILRWVAVIALVGGSLYALYGLLTKAAWASLGDTLGAAANWALRINLFIGIALWLLRFNNIGFNAFYNAVHPIIMLVALGLAEMLAVRRRLSLTPAGKWRLLLLGTLVPLLLILSAIPAADRLAFPF